MKNKASGLRVLLLLCSTGDEVPSLVVRRCPPGEAVNEVCFGREDVRATRAGLLSYIEELRVDLLAEGYIEEQPQPIH
jgi:hypothetical protein